MAKEKAIAIQQDQYEGEPLFLDLSDCSMQDLSLVGGKAANLARLSRIPGIRVPQTVIITSKSFDLFLQANPELLEMIAHLDAIDDQDQLVHQAADVRAAMRNAVVPESVQAAIDEAYRLLERKTGKLKVRASVRSSATAEDLPGASFAGQYDTYLNQEGWDAILDSVRGVWASTYGENAMCYRRDRKLKHLDTKMAVILQQMVDALVSGTAFTVDLESGLPMIRIHANYGLGEAEVGGTVTPDTWIVDPETMVIVKRCLGKKTEKIVCDSKGAGTVSLLTSAQEQAEYGLDSNAIRSLAQDVKRIGDHYSANANAAYVDTEYAINNEGQIIFLQARPETVWARGATCLVAVDCECAKQMPRIYSGGFTGSSGVATGAVRVAASLNEAIRRVKPGDILAVANTTSLWERVLGLAAGVITDIGGAGSHTATVMREQGKPALVGADYATGALVNYDNQEITLDATQRIVFLGKAPSEWLIAPSHLQPMYGTLDRETEEESWIEATKTGQTCVGKDGRKWIGKPKHPVSKFMQEIYLRCHKWMGERLQKPVTAEIQAGVHRLDFHELFQWRLSLRAMTLEELESLQQERQAAAQAYIEASNAFELTPHSFVRWIDSLIRMNAFVGLAFNLYKVTEGLLARALAAKETPEPFYSQIRSALGALLGETEATKELRQYKSLLDEARQNNILFEIFQRVNEAEDLKTIRMVFPEYYLKLRRHASAYKIGEGTDLVTLLEIFILEIVLRLKDDLAQNRQIEIPGVRIPAKLAIDSGDVGHHPERSDAGLF